METADNQQVKRRPLILQFFEYEHLREDLRPIGMPFSGLAKLIVSTLPRNPERTVWALSQSLDRLVGQRRSCLR
jgi:hypothetical protein